MREWTPRQTDYPAGLHQEERIFEREGGEEAKHKYSSVIALCTTIYNMERTYIYANNIPEIKIKK